MVVGSVAIFIVGFYLFIILFGCLGVNHSDKLEECH